jgi:receptor expression-enhancing protein 5/6
MEQAQYYQAQFDKELSKHPFWNLIEKQTGAPKVYVAGGLAALTFVFVFFNLFASLITGLIGWTYPGRLKLFILFQQS